MKYRIEISEEQLRVIGLAVDEYMRVRMGQFEYLANELSFDGYCCQIGYNAKPSPCGFPHFVKETCERVANLFQKGVRGSVLPERLP